MAIADPGQLAVDYLLAVRRSEGEAVDDAKTQLASLPEAHLVDALDDDRARVAFWVDLYNAAVMEQPHDELAGWASRMRFFSRPVLAVAGHDLSLDVIEHGLLRHSHPKLGLGYLRHPRPSVFERRLRVDRVDPRIHFALNCAAASCPPIASYQAEQLDAQLNQATRSYLDSEVQRRGNVLTIPRVFLWFVGDFGGPPGIRSFLREHGVAGWGGSIRFARWDWTPTPGDWAADSGPAAAGGAESRHA